MRLAPPVVSLFAVAALAALASSARAQSISFDDVNFFDTDWTVTAEGVNLGGNSTGFMASPGGNPLSYRRVWITLNSAVGQPSNSNSVYAFHARIGATFAPASHGQIMAIDYTESSMRFGNSQQSCGLAIRQGGVIYYGPSFLNPFAVATWAPTSQPGLTAASFDALAPGVQNPNFRVGAPPIEFGFFRASSTSVVGGEGTDGGIDNWNVTIHFSGATAVAASSWGRVKALYR
jgi:hypothetical protein